MSEFSRRGFIGSAAVTAGLIGRTAGAGRRSDRFRLQEQRPR